MSLEESSTVDDPYLDTHCPPNCNSDHQRCIHTLERVLAARQSQRELKELKLYRKHIKEMKLSQLEHIIPLTIMDDGDGKITEVDDTDDDLDTSSSYHGDD